MATVDPASNQGSKITTALKVGSGVDIQDLATSLSEAELSPKIEKAENKISDSETKISAIGVLSASIESITSALAALEDNSSITSFHSRLVAVQFSGGVTVRWGSGRARLVYRASISTRHLNQNYFQQL